MISLPNILSGSLAEPTTSVRSIVGYTFIRMVPNKGTSFEPNMQLSKQLRMTAYPDDFHCV